MTVTGMLPGLQQGAQGKVSQQRQAHTVTPNKQPLQKKKKAFLAC